MRVHLRDDRGFTLIELMVAMAVAGIVMAAIFATYQNQTRTHLTQQSVVDMHQNARAAMHLMKSEIRMAGYDPTGTADATVLTATAGDFRFQIDANGDGTISGSNEDIRYALSGENLGRETVGPSGPSGLQPVANNIEALEFIYFDENLDRFTSPPTDQPERDRVRKVLVTIVARADDPVMAFKQVNRQTYTNSFGETVLSAANDTSRRTLLSTSIWCRNMGM